MAARARHLTETDRAEWAMFVRRIVKLDGRAVVEPPPPASVLPPIPKPEPARAAPRARARPLDIGGHPDGLDGASWQRFHRGKLTTSRKLDLHGMTAQHAFHALCAFLRTAHADRLRCVEVVTGRGSGEAGGVIRREFPMWLNLPDLRPLVLAAAHPHAANSGSVRLLLRRPRP